MEEMIANISLKSSDKIILIIAAIIVILLILVIMYKIDNIPEDYKKRKKHNFKSKNHEEPLEEDDENYELESQIDNYEPPAEEKMEELFKEDKTENNILAANSNSLESLFFDSDIENIEKETTEDNPKDIINEKIEAENEEYNNKQASNDLKINIFDENNIFSNDTSLEKATEEKEIITEIKEKKSEEKGQEEYSMFTDNSFTEETKKTETKAKNDKKNTRK